MICYRWNMTLNASKATHLRLKIHIDWLYWYWTQVNTSKLLSCSKIHMIPVTGCSFNYNTQYEKEQKIYQDFKWNTKTPSEEKPHCACLCTCVTLQYKLIEENIHELRNICPGTELQIFNSLHPQIYKNKKTINCTNCLLRSEKFGTCV